MFDLIHSPDVRVQLLAAPEGVAPKTPAGAESVAGRPDAGEIHEVGREPYEDRGLRDLKRSGAWVIFVGNNNF